MIRTKFQALEALKDVKPEFVFWLCDGSTIKNLDELLEHLKMMNEETFKYHVNQEKNDFAKWVYDIIKDEKLANDLKKSQNKAEFVKIISNRIKWLKKKAELKP
ncbi:MAG: DUF5752 family protein [Candidatus Woesearchaeota archaeon]